jgi:hypothetical protein
MFIYSRWLIKKCSSQDILKSYEDQALFCINRLAIFKWTGF